MRSPRSVAAMLPDWENEDNYPESLAPEGWAWEFLRRNKDYKTSWDKYLARRQALLEKYGPEDQWPATVHTGTDVWYFDPPALEGETQSAWRARIKASGQVPRGPLPLSHGMGEEWGLAEMFNPSFTWMHLKDVQFGPRFFERRIRIEYFVGNAGEDKFLQAQRGVLPDRLDVALIQVDLARNISGQLAAAALRLEQAQSEYQANKELDPPKKAGPTNRYYRDLLRIYDAYQAKKSSIPKLNNERIAEVIYPDGDGSGAQISARHKTAVRYVEKKGYLAILP